MALLSNNFKTTKPHKCTYILICARFYKGFKNLLHIFIKCCVIPLIERQINAQIRTCKTCNFTICLTKSISDVGPTSTNTDNHSACHNVNWSKHFKYSFNTITSETNYNNFVIILWWGKNFLIKTWFFLCLKILLHLFLNQK